jgi:signal transduction histidine kinase
VSEAAVKSDPAALLATLRAAMAHELNQPLAVARGYLELMETRDDETMRRMGPERVREAIERAALLVDDLARLIELELGASVPGEAGGAALAAACERASGLAAARHVTVEVNGEPGPTDPIALGALLAAAVEKAERGTTVRVEAGPQGVVATWEGDVLPGSVAAGIAAQRWRGDAASLAAHVARRRLEQLDGRLEVGERSLAVVMPPEPPGR